MTSSRRPTVVVGYAYADLEAGYELW